MFAPLYFTLGGLGAALLLYYTYFQITFFIGSRRAARIQGCKPVKADRHWDPFLGLDFVISTIFASRRKYQLEDLQDRFNRISHTFTSDVLGDKLIFTDEPKNAQAVLATQFAEFDIGELRRQATVKLLGHGIFNADGAYWEHSRALIRPNFVRKQVGDLRLMEHHVMAMISHLPGDGTPVNIQDFFFRMVCFPVRIGFGNLALTFSTNRPWTPLLNSFSENPSTLSVPTPPKKASVSPGHSTTPSAVSRKRSASGNSTSYRTAPDIQKLASISTITYAPSSTTQSSTASRKTTTPPAPR